jgi:hypothetical protein
MSVAVVDRPVENDTTDWMRTVHEKVKAASNATMLGPNDPWVFAPVWSGDELTIKTLIDMGYEPDFSHPANSKEKETIVYRLPREEYGEQYATEARKLELKLGRKDESDGTEITGVEGRARNRGKKTLESVINSMPANDLEAKQIAASRLTIDGVVPTELLADQ